MAVFIVRLFAILGLTQIPEWEWAATVPGPIGNTFEVSRREQETDWEFGMMDDRIRPMKVHHYLEDNRIHLTNQWDFPQKYRIRNPDQGAQPNGG
ncbi:hypothetical protein PCANC_18720 [Puccinia coronata f. sp. avenae]|uniref:Uncharacterized protein n=1 Tax=Puccinia coronata f. sp. avenae TaxID=200324 RepID=A0A2N5UAV6_9BASI|nr:hypothetical protein PCASD_24317 [Puccinia coronata f. sp. avenae]PLW34842.1 hypothetical protein PCANC_18720 [Puccinia coronata f. sp. avenae]